MIDISSICYISYSLIDLQFYSGFFLYFILKISFCLIFDNLESEMWKIYWLFVKKLYTIMLCQTKIKYIVIWKGK